jgi:RNA polymerase sporulation-specific sigma factor
MLAAAAQQGDKAALNALLSRYRAFARRAASGFNGVFMEQDDYFQEAMLALLSAAYTYAPGQNASFKTYAAVCVRNRLRSVLRAESAEKNAPLNTYVPLEEVTLSGGENPESSLISAQETEALFRFFDRELSPLEKQVLNCRLDGLSYTEISARLHITEKSTDNALQRVRVKLKKILNS